MPASLLSPRRAPHGLFLVFASLGPDRVSRRRPIRMICAGAQGRHATGRQTKIQRRHPRQAEDQEHAMSLSCRQEHQLPRVKAGVRRSDPHLGAMSGVSGRLHADDGMPA
jgi:hypothetical protein